MLVIHVVSFGLTLLPYTGHTKQSNNHITCALADVKQSIIQKLSVISQEKTDLQIHLAHLEQKKSQSVGSNGPTEGNSSNLC